jgi:mono/diheme cytochrome c family protein
MVVVVALLLTGALGVLWLDRLPDSGPAPAQGGAPDPATVARGEYLAQAAHCAGCHTARGGAPYAGGRAIATPFGTVFTGNLTPDPATGLGAWTAEDFWRALHHGRGRDGRRLVPAFPYTEYTRIARADSDALWAYLRTLPPVVAPTRRHDLHGLGGLFGSEWALAAWRVLFFRPGEWVDDAARSAEWNRGAYLVQGPGHCAACHGGRNALGATRAGLAGGWLPARNGYAPALTRSDEGAVHDWPLEDIAAWLRDGATPDRRAVATGAMAEVVRGSTRHLSDADRRAMAVYLRSLPRDLAPARKEALTREQAAAMAAAAELGRRVYADHCAACHGAQGGGGRTAQGRWVVPPLAGNRMVTMEPAVNLVRAIAQGGFGVAGRAEPRPFSMAPYAHLLGDAEIAAVATHLRSAWGERAAPVSALDVARWRGASGD